MSSLFSFPYLTAVGIVILVLFLLTVILSGYVKAAPDTAVIISGFRKEPRELIGKAGIRIPFLERLDKLSLKLIPIDVKTSSSVPTADYINIMVDSAVNVQIGRDKELLKLAAKNFLNQKPEYIAQIAREVLEGNMREIVGQMELREMVSNRQKFAELVKENAAPDLGAMGLVIVSFNVQNFTDGEHVIENLGVDNVVAISKSAAVSRANSEKEIKIAQALADQEANEARMKADKDIAEKQNALEVRRAELKLQEDTKKAEADAAYKIEEQKQRKFIDIASQEADIAKQEKEAELQRQMAEVKEQSLTAEVRKQAEADRYAAQQAAEAEKFRKQQEAEAIKAMGEAEAEAIKVKGEAEADAIRAKGVAEAEAMEKKAQAYQKYNDAAVTQLVIEQLPAIAEAIAKPIASIDKVTVIDSGNGEGGVAQVGGYTPAVLAKVIESVRETTGFDLREVMKAGTYDAKVNKNIRYEGDPLASFSQTTCSGSATGTDDAATDADETASDL